MSSVQIRILQIRNPKQIQNTENPKFKSPIVIQRSLGDSSAFSLFRVWDLFRISSFGFRISLPDWRCPAKKMWDMFSLLMGGYVFSVGFTSVAAAILAAAEGGILPPGPEVRNGSDFSSHKPIPPGRMPGSTAGKMPAATLSTYYGRRGRRRSQPVRPISGSPSIRLNLKAIWNQHGQHTRLCIQTKKPRQLAWAAESR